MTNRFLYMKFEMLDIPLKCIFKYLIYILKQAIIHKEEMRKKITKIHCMCLLRLGIWTSTVVNFYIINDLRSTVTVIIHHG